MKSEALESTRFSAVAFSRDFVFAEVELARKGGGTPNTLAKDIAEALDGQIKQALSR